LIYDLGQADYSKASNVYNNLKSLCEGLQKQNQDLIDENKKLQNDEKELRSTLAADFQTRINTISTQLEEQAREHLHKSKENELYIITLGIVKERLLGSKRN
jgi:regulator of replication initiation timing